VIASAITTAADHALDLEPLLREALFNRAVILDTLSFRTAAAKAYTNFLKAGRASAWSVEVEARLARLRSPSTAYRWPSIELDDLRRAAAADDVLAINDAAITAPELMRGLAETVLVQWGRRTLARDAAGASELLVVARILGTSLRCPVAHDRLNHAQTLSVRVGRPSALRFRTVGTRPRFQRDELFAPPLPLFGGS